MHHWNHNGLGNTPYSFTGIHATGNMGHSRGFDETKSLSAHACGVGTSSVWLTVGVLSGRVAVRCGSRLMVETSLLSPEDQRQHTQQQPEVEEGKIGSRHRRHERKPNNTNADREDWKAGTNTSHMQNDTSTFIIPKGFIEAPVGRAHWPTQPD